MAPRLRVLAGTSPSTMVPITELVNTSKGYKIISDLFEGEIIANIQGLTDEKGELRDSEYFKREDRKGVTWSIQVQGRFLAPYSADDILFGNTFDRPLKLPWGTSAVLKFMNYIDPTLQHDLQSSTKPWALSPLISTMPYFAHKRLPSSSSSEPRFPPTESVKDSTGELYLTVVDDDSSSSSSSVSSGSASSSGSRPSPAGSVSSSKSGSGIKQAMQKMKPKRKASRREGELQSLNGPTQRRSYFANEKKRKSVVFGPEDVITTDFCYGFINFAPTLSLQLPGGLSFDLERYWDGQPVRFVCCERKDPDADAGNNQDPWGRIFWCVAIEVADDA